MISTTLSFNHSEYSDKALNSSISDILNVNTLCSIATIKSSESYINTAYYCFNKHLDFYFISDPITQHVKNIEENPSVAVSIYESNQSWDNNKKGLQVFGTCEVATGNKLIEGTTLYLQRFAGLKQWIQHPDDFIKGIINTRLYLIKSNMLKLFDEDNFGEENFIVLNLNK
jgi:uncharacterized protein YhbP (UPF0306 family)